MAVDRQYCPLVAIASLMRAGARGANVWFDGLLTASGLNNDQLHTLFGLVALSMVAGIVCAVVTAQENRLPYQVMVAALCTRL